jgi:hypothetical protein
MIAAFDIFRGKDGDLMWIEASPTLDAAKALVKQLMDDRPAHYLIFDQKTGNKISIKPGDLYWSAVA